MCLRENGPSFHVSVSMVPLFFLPGVLLVQVKCFHVWSQKGFGSTDHNKHVIPIKPGALTRPRSRQGHVLFSNFFGFLIYESAMIWHCGHEANFLSGEW